MNDEIKRKYLDNKITSFAIDADEYKDNAIDWCNLYLEILDYDKMYNSDYFFGSDFFPRFYIKNLEKAMMIIPEKEREQLIEYFNLKKTGGIRYYLKNDVGSKDIELKKMRNEAKLAIDYLKSFKALYIFHPVIHDVMDKISKKIKDNEKYSVIECAKYAHIYYRYIKDFQYMPYDEDRNHILNQKEIFSEESKYPIQEVSVLNEEWDFFKDIPDEDLIIPMIKSFLLEANDEIDFIISEDGQLVEDCFLSIPFGKIREVKEKHFKCGEWIIDYCRMSQVLQHMEEIILLQKAYQEYYKNYRWKWEAKKSKKEKVYFPSKGIKEIEIPVFGEVTFKDEFELMQWGHLLKYLKEVS